MQKRAGRALLFAAIVLLGGSLRAETFSVGTVTVAVLERGRVASGIEVAVNGSAAGTTDGNGMIDLELGTGRFQLTFLRDGVVQASQLLQMSERQSAEMSINLVGLGREPARDVRYVEAGRTEGGITGAITDSNGNALSGAVVSIIGRDESVTTGQDGRFELNAPRGNYELSLRHPRMEGARVPSARSLAMIDGDLTLAMQARRQDAAGTMEEVVVVASFQPTTAVALERMSDSILDVISEQDIKIAGDLTAADALTRVTGVTVKDNLVVVRGLGERYSATFFNGAELPSTNPTRRAIGLNIFPTELISGITVQKTYSADLPADFSGGAVRIETRAVPDQFTGSFSVFTGANSRSTFLKGFTHKGGDTDFLGIDDGDRDIPAIGKQLTANGFEPLSQLSPEENELVAETLANDFRFNLRGIDIPADSHFDFMLGNRFEFGEVDLGVNVSGIYDSRWRYVNEERAEVLVDGDLNTFAGEDSQLERTEATVRAGGVVNLVANIGYDHTISYTSLLSRESLKGTFFEEGFNRSDDRDFRRVILEFTEAQLFTNQLSGDHVFNDARGLELGWQVALSNAKRDEPATREYTYSRPVNSDLALSLATGPGQAGLPPLVSWEYLDEDAIDASFDLGLPVSFRNGSIDGKITVGGRVSQREREFDSVRWRYALSANAGADDPAFFALLALPSPETILRPSRLGPNGFSLVNASSALAGGANADIYRGEHDIYAGFVQTELDFGDMFRIQAGLRVETSDLSVVTGAIAGTAPIIGRIDETDYLPSLNLTWFSSESSQVRFGLSQTVNRPQFRELSTNPFRDPDTRFESVGNPFLQQSTVTNLDLRYEYYWSSEEGITVAAFYKDLKDPIEVVIIGGGSDDRGVRSFANAEKGELYGVEIDGRYLVGSLFGGPDWLSSFYVSGNLALIESEVTVSESVLGVGTNPTRELQGQSPWVANLGLGYSNPVTGTDALLAFNMFGKRIVEAGINLAPDAKEQPRAMLDFNMRKVFFDDWTLGIRLRNILDSEFEIRQGTTTQRGFRSGREAQISLSYDF